MKRGSEALQIAESKDKDKAREIQIHIDNKGYKTSKNPITGGELKQLGGIAGNYDLWQKIPGKDDKLIKDSDSVQLKNGDHFYSAPSSLNPGRH